MLVARLMIATPNKLLQQTALRGAAEPQLR
jgi:hypothetical protein